MKDITVQELKEKMDKSEEFVFIDVREPHEYEAYNLGAELIPLGNIPEAIPGLLEDYKDKEIVVHCRSGQRSGMAKQMMVQAGFTNVRNLEGGVLAWADAYEK